MNDTVDDPKKKENPSRKTTETRFDEPERLRTPAKPGFR